MLTNDPFYFGSVRKVVVAFGSMFSDLHIIRTDDTLSPTEYKTIKVPLTYGPKEKWMIRNVQNPMPGTDDQVEMTLPRMSYEMLGFTYDPERQLPHSGRTVKPIIGDRSSLLFQYNPVPYNFSFRLNIEAKTIEDGLMIVEQIVPFFVPDYTVTIEDIDDLDLFKDVVMVLNSVDHEDTWEGNFQTPRKVTWTMMFTAKAYLYPPVSKEKIILKSNLNWKVDAGVDIPGKVPSYFTIPIPSDADADTVIGGTDSRKETTIIVLALPSSASLSPTHSKAFTVNVLNAPTREFTAIVPVTTFTPNDSYVIDSVHNTFTYTCGAGLRVHQETLVITFASVDDPLKRTSVQLVLNAI